MSADPEGFEDIKTGRGGWIRAYRKYLAVPISDPDRFFKALDAYGANHLFEALLIASTKKLTGDPLNFIITVAHNIWREDEKSKLKEEEYADRLDQVKRNTEQYNNELADKLKRAREL